MTTRTPVLIVGAGPLCPDRCFVNAVQPNPESLK